MSNTVTQQVALQEELIPMALEALADSPTYVAHICNTMASCGSSFRAGDDRTGMSSFARGASDLGQFIQLLEHMEILAQPTETVATAAFKTDLQSCLKSIESAMLRQDLVTLSDEIEDNLVPLLHRWNSVAEELQTGFDLQA